MPGSLKLMFWNIQNVYDYKIVMPDELELEATISEDSAMHTKKLRKLEKGSEKLYGTKKSDYRRTIAEIIGVVNPDIVAIVEFSVGKSDLVESGLLESSGSSKVSKAAITFDHWGPIQYQVELNDYYKDKLNIDRLWQSRLSKVNCSDLIAYVDKKTDEINTIQHKNSMFELYGLIWDSKKIALIDNFMIVNQGVNGVLEFPERAPGYARFMDQSGNQFSLAMIHSVFGKGSDSVVIGLRAKAINYLSQLALVKLAAKGNPNAKPQPIAPSPIVVAGDFNLDYDEHKDRYKPLADLGFKPRISGKTSIGKPSKNTPQVYRKSAYDNIFTLHFANDGAAGTIHDFAEDHFAVLDANQKPDPVQLAKALMISDHLPVSATLQFT